MVETDDDYWMLEQTRESQFFDLHLEEVISTQQMPTNDSKTYLVLCKLFISLSDHVMVHERSVYNVMDLLGDYGGYEYILMTLVALFVGPVAEHSFLLKAISKLYLVRTEEDQLFLEPTGKKYKRKRRKSA